MVMVTKGLSMQRLQDVEKFDAHAALVELLLLLKDTVSDPKLMNDLAKRKVEALKLTADEEHKRQEALDLISRTDELKNSFLALDQREAKITQQHKDNLNQIDLMKAEAKSGFDARDKAMKESELALAKKKTADEALNQQMLAKHKQLEAELRKRQDDMDKKNDYLKGWENDIAQRLNSVVDREKALFGK